MMREGQTCQCSEETGWLQANYNKNAIKDISELLHEGGSCIKLSQGEYTLLLLRNCTFITPLKDLEPANKPPCNVIDFEL